MVDAHAIALALIARAITSKQPATASPSAFPTARECEQLTTLTSTLTTSTYRYHHQPRRHPFPQLTAPIPYLHRPNLRRGQRVYLLALRSLSTKIRDYVPH